MKPTPKTIFCEVQATPPTCTGQKWQILDAAVPVSRRSGLSTLLAGALMLAGCGGGGGGGGIGGVGDLGVDIGSPSPDSGANPPGDVGVAGVSSGGTGSVSVGAVTGFGSVIVNNNGVRIDDTLATIADEDGANLKGKLKLGMQVIVTSTTAASGAVTAQSILVGGELLGRIEQIDPGKSFTVLGQKVIVVGSTVFDATLPDSLSGLAALALNNIVEVHGFLDAKRNELTATYVQRKASASRFRIQGEVQLGNTLNKLKIGTLDIDFTSAMGAPVDRAVMRIRLAPHAPPLPAEWTATRIQGIENLGQNRELYEIEARISDFTSPTAFKVNGLPVNASGAGVVVINPIPIVLAAGVRVQVKGTLTAGTLFAQQIKVEDDSELDALEYELRGAITGLSGNAVPGSFTLLGSTNQTVQFNASTLFPDGTVANLQNGRIVEVKGTAVASGAGTVIAATRIKFE